MTSKKRLLKDYKTLNIIEDLQNGRNCLSSNLDNIKIEVDISRHMND